MMRLQILHLPAPEGEWPFAVVFDGVDPNDIPAFTDTRIEMAARIGARAIFVFETTVEIV